MDGNIAQFSIGCHKFQVQQLANKTCIAYKQQLNTEREIIEVSKDTPTSLEVATGVHVLMRSWQAQERNQVRTASAVYMSWAIK